MKIFFSVNKLKRKRGRHKSRRQNILHHLREFFWPTIGGAAFLRFMEIKVKRAKGSAHAIAFGLAAGAFVSFTPFVGLHSSMVLVLCYLFSGSYVMGIIGTLVGNPWTFPLIWIFTYRLGNAILDVHAPHPFPQELSLKLIMEDWNFYFDAFLWPMTVGGTPVGLLVGFILYRIIFSSVSVYRSSRELKLKESRTKWERMKSQTLNIKDKIGDKVQDIEDKITLKAKGKKSYKKGRRKK